jgi:hypothetical protein
MQTASAKVPSDGMANAATSTIGRQLPQFEAAAYQFTMRLRGML